MSDSRPILDPDKLRRRRVAAGLNQTDLAQATGIQQSHLSKLERGRSNTTARSLAVIARALDCEIKDLMPDEPKRKAA